MIRFFMGSIMAMIFAVILSLILAVPFALLDTFTTVEFDFVNGFMYSTIIMTTMMMYHFLNEEEL